MQHMGRVHGARDAQFATRIVDSRSVICQMKLSILRTIVVEDTRQQVEGRIDAQLVQERIVAVVGLTDLDRIIARASADAEDAEPDECCRSQKAHDHRGPRAAMV